MKTRTVVKQGTRLITARPLIFNTVSGRLYELDGSDLRADSVLVDSRAIPNKDAIPPPVVYDKEPDAHGFTVSGSILAFPFKFIWGLIKWMKKKKK